MNDERQAFLQAIIENPADDAPRLIYADWLDEHGDPRGEFVRVQVELAPRRCELSPCPHGNCPSLRRRERELLEAHGEAWREDFARAVGDVTPHYYAVDVEYTRGFISHVTLALADWCGAECRWCRGDGQASHDSDYGDCTLCRGTGRVGGHGLRIVACCPLEKVTLAGKSPLKSNGKQSSFRWTWRPAEEAALEFWQLPRELFSFLPTGAGSGCILIRDARENWTSRLSVRDYDSEATALDALCAACLAWGRRQARLPPLPVSGGVR